MGRLVKKRSREETVRTRRERQEAILAKAAEAFTTRPWEDIQLEGIARAAGLAGGMASLYYGGKTELFLEVVKYHLGQAADELAASLDSEPGSLSPPELAARLAHEFADRPLQVRLLVLLRPAFEQAVEVYAGQLFVEWLHRRAAELGGLLEARCPALAPGDGAAVLLELEILAVGLAQTRQASAAFAAALTEELPDIASADLARQLGVRLAAAIDCRLRSRA